MKVLWSLEEASVREIREQLAGDSRPLAYTTVETIMDRLTRKGAVERRKVGKAHRYTAVYRREDARVQAVAALVDHFFDGSKQALVAHLTGAPAPSKPRSLRSLAPPRAGLAAHAREARAVQRPRPVSESIPEAPIDTSLL